MKKFLFVLLLGAAGGAAGGYYGRPQVERLTGADEVEGIIVDERREDERLVLTLRAGDETILASFGERADDVAELVAVGDALTIRRVAAHRGVFADDLPIVRLRRAADMAVEVEPEPEADTHRRRHRRGHDEETADEETADEETAEGADAEPAEAGDEAPEGESAALPLAEDDAPASEAPASEAPAHGARHHRET